VTIVVVVTATLVAYTRSLCEISIPYMPGGAEVCLEIAVDRQRGIYDYTNKWNNVTIEAVSQGHRLNCLQPTPTVSLMEGKAMLYKQFGNIDAFTI
jgi:malate dehydrogenase (oxaloacetate-decarboxylating)